MPPFSRNHILSLFLPPVYLLLKKVLNKILLSKYIKNVFLQPKVLLCLKIRRTFALSNTLFLPTGIIDIGTIISVFWQSGLLIISCLSKA